MGNNNYARGAAFERKVKEHLESLGYYTVRAAGSHGLTDVIAVRYDDIERGHAVLFIQCKTGKAKMSRQDKADLDALAAEYGAVPYEVSPINYKEILNG